eukprot:7867331-Pyramimonas_sp.AAC.1
MWERRASLISAAASRGRISTSGAGVRGGGGREDRAKKVPNFLQQKDGAKGSGRPCSSDRPASKCTC